MLKNAPTLVIVAVRTAENGPPKVLVEKLVVEAGALMENFLWRPEKEFEEMPLSSEAIEMLEKLFKTILELFKSLNVNPIATSLKKLSILEKKYPVEIVKGKVAKYFQRKKEIYRE